MLLAVACGCVIVFHEIALCLLFFPGYGNNTTEVAVISCSHDQPISRSACELMLCPETTYVLIIGSYYYDHVWQ